jgi:DNA-binding PucR family transcriptional regulator
MLQKLQTLFANAIIATKKPDNDFSIHLHWFTNDEQNQWVGIPKNELADNQLMILRSLFNYYQPGHLNSYLNETAQHWHSFLFENGPIPPTKKSDEYRLIYFWWLNADISRLDFEVAVQAFFNSTVTIIWENTTKGIIIEPKSKLSLTETDFISMNETLKVDFFVEPYFYIGKFRPVSHDLAAFIENEQSLFRFVISARKKEKLFYFEKVMPLLISNQLPDEMKFLMEREIIPLFKDDFELFSTVKVFLENNMNASVTAKKLFIHRNTLQYRLDKFTEKTGIPLKEFYSTFTVYLACIMFEQQN